MEVSTLIQQSLIIMVIGLSIVFLFLSVLILSVNLSHRIIHLLKLDSDTESSSAIVKDKNIIAAVTAAVIKFRQEKNK